MAIVTRNSLINRVFTDTKNYPYGFSRSGDFSISESKALTQYGSLISALVDGVISAENEEDRGYLRTAFGEKEPETSAERAWMKYQKRINRPKLGNIYGNKVRQSADEEYAGITDVDDDSVIELDVDTD